MSAAAATQTQQPALDLDGADASTKQVAKKPKNQQVEPASTKKHATRSQTKQALAQQEREQQHVDTRTTRQVEETEANASAEAKAGLNLNLAGAISGVFGGRSRKTVDTAADGSSRSVEDKEGAGAFKGRGAGTMTAVGEGKASASEKRRKMVEAVDEEKTSRKKKNTKAVKQVDHLGLGEVEG